MQPAQPDAAPQTTGAPITPPASPLATMPAGLGRVPRGPDPSSAPYVTPDTPDEHLPKEPSLDDLKNAFERRGLLLAQAVEDQGRRIADAMQQPPTNSVKLSDAELRDFWRYSPVATDEATANAEFWRIHDQVLAATGNPTQAEQQALQQVYPHRASLVGQGVASIDKQVETANSIQKIVDGKSAPDNANQASLMHYTNQQVTSA